jgi:hypothetical protein
LNATRKRSRRLWIGAGVIGIPVIAALILLKLFTTRPAEYHPIARQSSQQVSSYLTHELAPSFNNQIQLDKPFRILVDQKGLNEIIINEDNLGWSWPINLNGVSFSAPSIVFAQDTIYLMGAVDVGFPVIISMIAKPNIDEEGKLRLNLLKIKAGSVNITGPARAIGGKIFDHQMQLYKDQWVRDAAAAFLKNTPFDPVFPVPPYKRFIRLTGAQIQDQKLILMFEPAGSYK